MFTVGLVSARPAFDRLADECFPELFGAQDALQVHAMVKFQVTATLLARCPIPLAAAYQHRVFPDCADRYDGDRGGGDDDGADLRDADHLAAARLLLRLPGFLFRCRLKQYCCPGSVDLVRYQSGYVARSDCAAHCFDCGVALAGGDHRYGAVRDDVHARDEVGVPAFVRLRSRRLRSRPDRRRQAPVVLRVDVFRVAGLCVADDLLCAGGQFPQRPSQQQRRRLSPYGGDRFLLRLY